MWISIHEPYAEEYPSTLALWTDIHIAPHSFISSFHKMLCCSVTHYNTLNLVCSWWQAGWEHSLDALVASMESGAAESCASDPPNTLLLSLPHAKISCIPVWLTVDSDR
jgi:hypothetical protein